MSEYPEHDKLQAISDKSQAIGEFLDWLDDRFGAFIACFTPTDEMTPLMISTNQLLAQFFEIDLDKIETEKHAMLQALRQSNDAVQPT